MITTYMSWDEAMALMGIDNRDLFSHLLYDHMGRDELTMVEEKWGKRSAWVRSGHWDEARGRKWNAWAFPKHEECLRGAFVEHMARCVADGPCAEKRKAWKPWR